MLRSADPSTFRSALCRSSALSTSLRTTRLAQTYLPLPAQPTPRTALLTSRSIYTTAAAKMPHMPQGIVKGGKEELKLNNQSLWQTKAYINGEWVSADNKSTLKVFNKATGAEIGQVPDLGAKETAAAIAAADEAFKSWSQTTAKHRHDLLMKLFYAHQQNAEDLAKIIVAENGKAFAEAKGELAYSNGFLECCNLSVSPALSRRGTSPPP
ncbi:hypothetical protein EX895_002974 [Sporisorium graminicola]|uniref:Aldehyde dehydrogenase domain-containing protein n=1 Tax=Sporisorium graminicola TaxID=280036 RepID=A0A4U7KUG8_9BASI|nr:hypothetical protein EX895_002974 [Sporisorium graminicola]TKY88264.1 hypothetical protein EX895_002974 [Sporisorium graminicola]